MVGEGGFLAGVQPRIREIQVVASSATMAMMSEVLIIARLSYSSSWCCLMVLLLDFPCYHIGAFVKLFEQLRRPAMGGPIA
jgi:hypothetical protein